jgi:hydroxymethylbilane synthase
VSTVGGAGDSAKSSARANSDAHARSGDERVVRVGTRGSALALAQSTAVANDIARVTGASIELVTVTTHGDTSNESLSNLGGTGVFASALRDALRRGECDVVVHSLKDLPAVSPDDLVIAAVPKRADARDALVSRDGLTLDTLPKGARVGTGSPRRAAQLRARRPDLDIVDIRGNVDTRVRRVLGGVAGSGASTSSAPGASAAPGASSATEVGSATEGGDLDAVVLAAAGLDRLGRSEIVSEYLGIDGWPTAPGQGALALEVRRGEENLVARLDHKPTHTIVDAERMVLAQLEAGCAAPIAVHGMIDDGMLFLSGRVYAAGPSTSSGPPTSAGTGYITASHALYVSDTTTPAADLAERVAAELLAQGAAEIAPL